MKRGLIILAVFMLLMPFSIAGQVSDYFKYFTNDAFSLVTGAQITGFDNPSLPNAGTAPQDTAKKANGASCSAHTQCKSNVCTKLVNKGVCGKGYGVTCASNTECFSGKCLSKKCDKSQIGKPCFRDAACATGLKCISNRCSRGQGQNTQQPSETLASQDESETLQATINNKIQELKTKADALLLSNEGETQAVPEQKTIVSRLLPNFLTGKFILQIVGIFKPPEVAAASVRNGASCEKNNDCLSHKCYKVRNTDRTGLCGEKQGNPCNANSECLSATCTARRCAKSTTNEPCLQNSDCSSNTCNRTTKKCYVVARAVVQQPLIRGQIRQPSQPGTIRSQQVPVANETPNIFISGQQAGQPSQPTIKSQQTQPPQAPIPLRGTQAIPKKLDGAGCKRSDECRSNLCICATGKCQAVAIEVTPPVAIAVDSENESKIPAKEIPVLNAKPATGLATISQPANKLILTKTPRANQDVGEDCSRNEECTSALCVCNIGVCRKFTPYTTPRTLTPPVLPIQNASALDKESENASEAPVEEEAIAVEEKPFDVISAQAILGAIFVKMKELNQKVCLIASKYRGIDYGNIKCRVAA